MSTEYDYTWSFEALGTSWDVVTRAPITQAVRAGICNVATAFDETWSRFRSDSLIARIATSPGGRWEVPLEDYGLLDLYDRLFEATGGGVDPLVGAQLENLGYDAAYTLRSRDGSLEPGTWERVGSRWRRDLVHNLSDGQAVVVTHRQVTLDIGAAGKGFLVDRVCRLLDDHGLTAYLVDASGDMRHAGSDSLRVGLEHPVHPEMVVGVAVLRGGALCASSTSRRTWGEGLHHVLDARTGQPVRDVCATWVVAADAATADGLATALFVVEPGQLADFEFEFVRMLSSGSLEASAGFVGELYL